LLFWERHIKTWAKGVDRMSLKRTAVLITIGLTLPALTITAQENVITVIAHDSFAYSEAVMQEFEQVSGIRVEVLRLGDAGSLVNQSILSRENPLGDVLFGVDNTFLARALDNDLFVAYESPVLTNLLPSFSNAFEYGYLVTPITYGDVCLNYDVAFFEERELEVPQTLFSLTDPQYAGLLVVQNPATSSPGLAFLLNTISMFGEAGDYTYLDFWQDLVANDVLIVDDWTDAYYGQFSGAGGSEGTRPLVVSYASSPAAEVYFAETELDTAPTAAILADNTCYRQVEYAGILQGTDNLEGAQQLIDFMLSVPFQNDIPLNMFVYPLNENAVIPDVFTQFAPAPEVPAQLGSAMVSDQLEAWIQTWTETILQS
jgi:thiamine transport system substrate-binding protein